MLSSYFATQLEYSYSNEADQPQQQSKLFNQSPSKTHPSDDQQLDHIASTNINPNDKFVDIFPVNRNTSLTYTTPPQTPPTLKQPKQLIKSISSNMQAFKMEPSSPLASSTVSPEPYKIPMLPGEMSHHEQLLGHHENMAERMASETALAAAVHQSHPIHQTQLQSPYTASMYGVNGFLNSSTNTGNNSSGTMFLTPPSFGNDALGGDRVQQSNVTTQWNRSQNQMPTFTDMLPGDWATPGAASVSGNSSFGGLHSYQAPGSAAMMSPFQNAYSGVQNSYHPHSHYYTSPFNPFNQAASNFSQFSDPCSPYTMANMSAAAAVSASSPSSAAMSFNPTALDALEARHSGHTRSHHFANTSCSPGSVSQPSVGSSDVGETSGNNTFEIGTSGGNNTLVIGYSNGTNNSNFVNRTPSNSTSLFHLDTGNKSPNTIGITPTSHLTTLTGSCTKGNRNKVGNTTSGGDSSAFTWMKKSSHSTSLSNAGKCFLIFLFIFLMCLRACMMMLSLHLSFTFVCKHLSRQIVITFV